MFGSKALHQQERTNAEADPAYRKFFLPRAPSTRSQRTGTSSPTSVASKSAHRRSSSVERLLDMFKGKGYNELDDDHHKPSSPTSPTSPASFSRRLAFRNKRRATVDCSGAATADMKPTTQSNRTRRIRSLGDVLQSVRSRRQTTTSPPHATTMTTPNTSFAAKSTHPTVPAPGIMVRDKSVHLMAIQGAEDDHEDSSSNVNTSEQLYRPSPLQKIWSQQHIMQQHAGATADVADTASDDGQQQEIAQGQQSLVERTIVRVPQTAVPGDRVVACLKTGRQVSFEIPSGAFPGDELEITVPLQVN